MQFKKKKKLMNDTVYALFVHSNRNQTENLATKVSYNWIGKTRPWGNIARDAGKSSTHPSFSPTKL